MIEIRLKEKKRSEVSLLNQVTSQLKVKEGNQISLQNKITDETVKCW